jgi:hypothetical protein
MDRLDAHFQFRISGRSTPFSAIAQDSGRPTLATLDRRVLWLTALFMKPHRVPKLFAMLKPAILLKFHKTLVGQRCRPLFRFHRWLAILRVTETDEIKSALHTGFASVRETADRHNPPGMSRSRVLLE